MFGGSQGQENSPFSYEGRHELAEIGPVTISRLRQLQDETSHLLAEIPRALVGELGNL